MLTSFFFYNRLENDLYIIIRTHNLCLSYPRPSDMCTKNQTSQRNIEFRAICEEPVSRKPNRPANILSFIFEFYLLFHFCTRFVLVLYKHGMINANRTQEYYTHLRFVNIYVYRLRRRGWTFRGKKKKKIPFSTFRTINEIYNSGIMRVVRLSTITK